MNLIHTIPTTSLPLYHDADQPGHAGLHQPAGAVEGVGVGLVYLLFRRSLHTNVTINDASLAFPDRLAPKLLLISPLKLDGAFRVLWVRTGCKLDGHASTHACEPCARSCRLLMRHRASVC